MERFINVFDVELKGIPVFDENLEAFVPLSVVRQSLQMTPTADVVPKSEYDAVVSAVDNSTKEFLKLHDDYQEAKREVENLKVLLEMTEKAHEGLKELYRTDTDALVEARRKTEVEVAREIFEEIYRSVASKTPMKLQPIFLDDRDYDAGVVDGKRDAFIEVFVIIAELKKKYTEDKT